STPPTVAAERRPSAARARVPALSAVPPDQQPPARQEFRQTLLDPLPAHARPAPGQLPRRDSPSRSTVFRRRVPQRRQHREGADDSGSSTHAPRPRHGGQTAKRRRPRSRYSPAAAALAPAASVVVSMIQ